MPPIKVISPGPHVPRRQRCATHSPTFNQVEGLWTRRGRELWPTRKGVHTDFLRKFFERDDIQVRFRPSYSPVHGTVGRDRHGVR
ncbi:tRNA ligase subunit PheS family protein [Cupriavidus basilensis]